MDMDSKFTFTKQQQCNCKRVKYLTFEFLVSTNWRNNSYIMYPCNNYIMQYLT